jgi:hypothetical protein
LHAEQPADRIQRSSNMGVRMGIHATGNRARLYNGQGHPFSLVEGVARTRWPSDP